MNATTLGLSLLAIVLGGFVLRALLLWARRFPWRFYLFAIPGALAEAWYSARLIIVPTALVFVLGLLGLYRFPEPPFSILETPRPGFWIIPVLATLVGGGALIWFVIIFFVMVVAELRSVPSGLSVVENQRVHDTGGYASASQIDAALRDRDEGGELVPEFEE